MSLFPRRSRRRVGSQAEAALGELHLEKRIGERLTGGEPRASWCLVEAEEGQGGSSAVPSSTST